MPEDQIPQVPKFQNREIARKRGLHALLTNNADANVGLKDHSYIIATISHCSNAMSASVVLDELAYAGFLSRRASTDAYARCFDS